MLSPERSRPAGVVERGERDLREAAGDAVAEVAGDDALVVHADV